MSADPVWGAQQNNRHPAGIAGMADHSRVYVAVCLCGIQQSGKKPVPGRETAVSCARSDPDLDWKLSVWHGWLWDSVRRMERGNLAQHDTDSLCIIPVPEKKVFSGAGMSGGGGMHRLDAVWSGGKPDSGCRRDADESSVPAF